MLILNDQRIGWYWLLLFSLILPLTIEFLLNSSVIARLREAFIESYKRRLQNDTEGRLFYRLYVKPLLIGIMIIIMVTPMLAEINSRGRRSYEICTIDNEEYAVIQDNSNDALVQPASIDGNTLTICTDSFRIVSKTDVHAFASRQFDQVIITGGRDADGNGQ